MSKGWVQVGCEVGVWENIHAQDAKVVLTWEQKADNFRVIMEE